MKKLIKPILIAVTAFAALTAQVIIEDSALRKAFYDFKEFNANYEENKAREAKELQESIEYAKVTMPKIVMCEAAAQFATSTGLVEMGNKVPEAVYLRMYRLVSDEKINDSRIEMKFESLVNNEVRKLDIATMDMYYDEERELAMKVYEESCTSDLPVAAMGTGLREKTEQESLESLRFMINYGKKIAHDPRYQ
ncbi:hypothetical protein KGV31_002153 [Vibrio parahaemolyticus]|nr:hypothetical protein [Vibrio parahaemolyticus]EHU0344296.1 hypothetical protein [Vibrio parahaemolyticus]EHU0354330.1 hypothetical protein [Vibrio parahaemolyticus]